MLHTLNKSPFEHRALNHCLRFIDKQSELLLIEDGVYAAMQSNPFAEQLRAVSVYALANDINARGVSDKLLPFVKVINYEEFVELCCKHDKVHAWY